MRQRPHLTEFQKSLINSATSHNVELCRKIDNIEISMREYVAVTSEQIRQLNDRVDFLEPQEKTNED